MATAVGLTLVACDPAGASSQPSLMRVIDGGVELKICADYVPEEIEALIKSTDGERNYFWRAAEGGRVEAGDVLSTSSLRSIFAIVDLAENPSPRVGENVAVRLTDSTDGERKLFSFVVTSEMLDGEWISSWGEVVPDGTCS